MVKAVMKIVIWGLGTRGKRIFSRLRPGEVVAFIDNDPQKVGIDYEGVPVVDLEQYIQEYSRYFILISLLKPEDVINQLLNEGIYTYFDALDCPAELWGPGKNVDLDGYLRALNQGKKYGIVGINFYGIFCYDRMCKEGSDNLFLIPETEEDPQRNKLIGNAFEFVRFISGNVREYDVEKIFVATGKTSKVQALKKNVGANVKIEDVFDLSRKIPAYRNPKIAQFKNVHLGKRCFIVATGPSLTMKDLDTLHQNGEFSIGMNRIFLAFEQTRWRPDYYMVEDWRCIQGSEETIRTMDVTHKFVSDQKDDFWEKKTETNIYKFHSIGMYVPGERPPFSDDLVYGVYSKGTVTYSCIQLAVYMGFREIYLLGVDFNFSKNYKDKSNHFVPTYYNENSQTGIFLKDESIESYEAAREYADAHGIRIYNATRGGKLEVFERRNFDDLFPGK